MCEGDIYIESYFTCLFSPGLCQKVPKYCQDIVDRKAAEEGSIAKVVQGELVLGWAGDGAALVDEAELDLYLALRREWHFADEVRNISLDRQWRPGKGDAVQLLEVNPPRVVEGVVGKDDEILQDKEDVRVIVRRFRPHATNAAIAVGELRWARRGVSTRVPRGELPVVVRFGDPAQNLLRLNVFPDLHASAVDLRTRLRGKNERVKQRRPLCDDRDEGFVS